MSSAVHQIQAFPTCAGDVGLLVGAYDAGPVATDQEVQLGLAALLGEREATGVRVPVVVLHQATHDDARWVDVASRWLAAHGRRVLIRTAVTLSPAEVDAAAEVGATVLLEIAHRSSAMQRALIGPHADVVASLLLQAQHLEAREIPVAAHIGPLLPGIHDRSADTLPLLQHVVAADVRHAHLSVGQLGPGRLAALSEILERPELMDLLRAFGADPTALDGEGGRTWRLDHAAHFGLYHDVELMAEDAGLRVDACGCLAQCHLDTRPREYLPLVGPDLFGRTAG